MTSALRSALSSPGTTAQLPLPPGGLDYATLTAQAPTTAKQPAKGKPAGQKPAEEKWAGQPFIGTVLKGSRISQDGRFTIPPQIPGVGGRSVKLPDGGDTPGLVVYFPRIKTTFLTGQQANVRVPGTDIKLKWVATVNDKGAVQFGVGNSHEIPGKPGNVFFWNTRGDVNGIARSIQESLRPENKGKEFVIGTINAGFLHKPACPSGKEPGHLSDLSAGTGFQAQLVSKDGQLMVKAGGAIVPLAIWEYSMFAMQGVASSATDLVCDGKTVAARAGDLVRGTMEALGRGASITGEQLATWGAGIASMLWGAASSLLTPRP